MKKTIISLIIGIILLSSFTLGALSDGVLSYWKMENNSGTIYDEVGRENLTLTNIQFGTGKINNGSVFNGLSSKAVGTSSGYLNLGVNGFSINTWSKQGKIFPNNAIIGKSDAGGYEWVFGYSGGVTRLSSFYNNVGWVYGVRDAPLNVWFMMTVVFNGTHYCFYGDGVFDSCSAGAAPPKTTRQLKLGSQLSDGNWFNGTLDEIGIWNRTLTASEVLNLNTSANLGYTYPTFSAPTVTLFNNITFLSQNPSNLTATTFFNTNLNLTFNVTNQSVSATNVLLNYSLIGNRNCLIFENGTCLLANNSLKSVSSTSNIKNGNSTLYSWILRENNVYSYTSLRNESFFNQAHTNYTLVARSDYLASKIINVSNATLYNIYELDVLDTNINSGTLYLCNSTFNPVNNPNPATVNYCQEISNINQTIYNHSHNAFSGHNIYGFQIINGRIGVNGVLITSNMWFITRGNIGGNINIGYINNATLTNSVYTTTNNGNAWTDRLYTIDNHLHQWSNTEYLSYSANALFNSTTTEKTSTITELIEITNINPTIPIIIIPFETIQNTRFLNITYQNATSFLGSIVYYNISLLNSNLTFNRTIQGNNSLNNNFLYDLYSQSLALGIYYIRVQAYDNLGLTSKDEEYFNLTRNAELNISVQDARNATLINNGSITITNLNTTTIESYNTTNANFSINIIKENTYLIIGNFTGYAYGNKTYNSNTSNDQKTILTLYTNNSVNINIYDEDTNFPITSNITVILTGIGISNTYTTITGQLYIDNIPDGTYTLGFAGGNYSLKTYTITVAQRSTQQLNAFLTTSINTVVFSTQDFDSSISLPGATYTQARLINGTWTIIDTRISDITGRIQFSYQNNINYQFVVTLTGYTIEQFNLDPVIFTSYTIRLKKITTLSPITTPQGLSVIINYDPTEFYNNGTNQTFTWTISDTLGSLTSYNLTTNTGNLIVFKSGINAYGETFSHQLNFSGANRLTDTFNLSYCYDTTIGSAKCFNYQYLIIGTYATTAFKANKNTTYGLGTFDRMFIVTFLVLVIAGIAFFIGGFMAGLPIALFLLGYFYYTGFISLWSILPSLLIGTILLLGRQE